MTGASVLADTSNKQMLIVVLRRAIRGGEDHGAKAIHIELDETDTYNMVFYKVRRQGLEVTETSRCPFISADNLMRVFEERTGLCTRKPTVIMTPSFTARRI